MDGPTAQPTTYGTCLTHVRLRRPGGGSATSRPRPICLAGSIPTSPAENLLATPDGDLAGVIDFGGLSVGDRSVDLLYAWSMFDEPAREVLRSESEADEVTWLRARAWAVVGPDLLSIENYRHSMPNRTAKLTKMVEAVAEEVGVSLR